MQQMLANPRSRLIKSRLRGIDSPPIIVGTKYEAGVDVQVTFTQEVTSRMNLPQGRIYHGS
jgi:hypothetical protein